MHWNNGKFHKSIHVIDKIYITDDKHVAISGTSDRVIFSNSDINTFIYGDDVDIYADYSFNAQAPSGIYLLSNGDDKGGGDITIESSNNNIAITAGGRINLNSEYGIVLDTNSYGTNLPNDSNNVDGRIFFKLIS